MRRLPAAMIAAALGMGLMGCSSDPDDAEAGPAEIRSYSGPSTVDADRDTPDGDGELAMPHLALRMSLTGAAESLSYDDAVTLGMNADYDLADGEQLVAPEGSEFVIATFTQFDAAYSEGSPAVRDVQLTVGSRTASAPIFSNGPEDTTLLVVAGKDDDVLVQINDAGGVATLDMRTGERVADKTTVDTSLYYPLGTPVPTAPFTEAAAMIGNYESVMYLKGAGLRLKPWNPVQGWAPAGSAWLSSGPLDVEVTTTSGAALPVMTMLFPWNQITVTPQGGAATNPQPFSILTPRGIAYTAQLAPEGISVQVPADARTFTLTFAPETTDSNTGDPVGPWTPATVTIDFSA